MKHNRKLLLDILRHVRNQQPAALKVEDIQATFPDEDDDVVEFELIRASDAGLLRPEDAFTEIPVYGGSPPNYLQRVPITGLSLDGEDFIDRGHTFFGELIDRAASKGVDVGVVQLFKWLSQSE